MGHLFKPILKRRAGERGQDLTEYALLLGLIAMAVIVGMTVMGENISTVFSSLASKLGTWW